MSGQTTARLEETDCERTREAHLCFIPLHGNAVGDAVLRDGMVLGKLFGVTGNVVLSRLLGVILAALAVQYVVDGVRAAFAF